MTPDEVDNLKPGDKIRVVQEPSHWSLPCDVGEICKIQTVLSGDIVYHIQFGPNGICNYAFNKSAMLDKDGWNIEKVEETNIPIASIPITVTPKIEYIPDWKMFRHNRDGECPCGIKREICDYHK